METDFVYCLYHQMSDHVEYADLVLHLYTTNKKRKIKIKINKNLNVRRKHEMFWKIFSTDRCYIYDDPFYFKSKLKLEENYGDLDSSYYKLPKFHYLTSTVSWIISSRSSGPGAGSNACFMLVVIKPAWDLETSQSLL